MARKITSKLRKDEPDINFPLTVSDLRPGYIYLCANGTVVICVEDAKTNNTVVNIENGVGCYTKTNTFRKFKANEINITVDENSESYVEFA